MRSTYTRILPLLIIVACPLIASGQDQYIPPVLLKTAQKIHAAFDENLKGWTRQTIEPIQGSVVFVENWDFRDRHAGVAVSLIAPNTSNEQWLADFLRHDRRAKRIEGIGEAGVVWGYGDSIITFHTKQFAVNVDGTTDFRLWGSMDKLNNELNLSESAATARLISCFLNLVLTDQLKRKHSPGDGFLSRPCEREVLYKGLLNPNILNEF